MTTPTGQGHLKLEIDDRERRVIERSLAERRSHLIEKAGDTTLTPARRQASYRELSAIASALRKLRRQNSAHGQDVAAGRFVQRVLQVSRAADGVSADDRRVLQRAQARTLAQNRALLRVNFEMVIR